MFDYEPPPRKAPVIDIRIHPKFVDSIRDRARTYVSVLTTKGVPEASKYIEENISPQIKHQVLEILKKGDF